MKVTLLGQDFELSFTTGAQEEIAKLCPGNDIKNLGDYMAAASGTTEQMTAIKNLAVILAKWGTRRAAVLGQEVGELTEDLFDLLEPREILALSDSLMAAMGADSKPDIEAEPIKRKN